MKPAGSWFSRNTYVTAAAVVLAAGVVSGCTTSTSSVTSSLPTTSPTGPITIGASLSLTNGFSADGLAFQKGYELWAHDVNVHGGIGGRQVKLVILDDKSSPVTVVNNYEKLVSFYHVDLLFGPFSSVLTGPAATVAARFGMALIEGAGGAPTVFDTPSNQADHNVFDVSLPVADEMTPFVDWIRSLPASQRPKSAAFPMAQDPFADPPVQFAESELQAMGVNTVYNQVFAENPNNPASVKPEATQVAELNADLVVLGSPDVPTVQEFMKVFAAKHYRPKMFIAAAGPDQGAAFTSAVGLGNANGMMVPNAWYPGYANPQSKQMVDEYVSKYGGNAAGVNADVAEAYSVGQVAALAIANTHGTDNAAIIAWLHNAKGLTTVQGPVQFDPLGENGSASKFIFQWQDGAFNQVLPVGVTGTKPITVVKPNWTS